LSTTEYWSGKALEEVTENEYRGLMTSHIMANTTMDLKNCSIEDELNQVKFENWCQLYFEPQIQCVSWIWLWWFDFKLEPIFDTAQLPQKMKLTSKVVKIDPKIIVSLPTI
jgi:hypothetical protein